MTEQKRAGDICIEVRRSLETESDETETAKMSLHLGECGSCQKWQKEMGDLTKLTAEMPQFDVSEALTQRILHDIEMAPAYSRPLMLTVVFLSCLAVATVVFYFMESGETVAGVLSWGIGIAVMACLKFLVCESGKVASALSSS